MKTAQAASRIEAELKEWKQREERLSRMFAFNVTDNRVFLREKLRHYDTVAARFKGTLNPEERLALRILRQESSRIEKQLYPNPWLRLLRRLTVEPIRRKHIARLQAREARRNEQMLKNALHQAGFGQVASKLQENIKQGLDGFTIPVSYHVNEKERMDFGLSFAKDQNGQYRFEGYRAALTGENKPQESRQQVFHIQEGGVTATEAYHLLSGRALQPQSCVGENKWLQLDFTDKDATGNHRVKEFRSGYGYDLEQTLRDLPLKENQNPELAGKLAAALAGGDRQQVTVERNGREQKFFIEANPQGKTVTLYDEHSRKVSLSSVLGRKPADTVRQAKESLKAEQHAKTEQHTGKARKNGMSIG